MTSTAQIQTLIDGYTALKLFFDEQKGDIAAAKASFNALSANLVGVVGAQMRFSALIDPDAAEPDEVDGGTFNTIAAAISAAPAGAYCEFSLMADKTYPIAANVLSYNRTLMFSKSGAGLNPVIAPVVYVSPNNLNFVYNILSFGGAVSLTGVDVLMPAKADVGLDWGDGRNSLIRYQSGGFSIVAMRDNTFTGVGGQAIATCTGSNHVNVGLFNVSLDGAVFAVSNVSQGTARIAGNSVTLLNGAALDDGGVVGTTLLKN